MRPIFTRRTAFPITPPSLGQGFRERPLNFVIQTSDSYQNLNAVTRQMLDEIATLENAMELCAAGHAAALRAANRPLLKIKLAGEGDAERLAAVRAGAAIGAMILAHRERMDPKPTQREMATERFLSDAHPGSLPPPGTYARHNAVDTIAGWMWMHDIAGHDKVFYTTGRLTFHRVPYDHAAAAAAVGQKMPQATVLVFGNPRNGTQQMINKPSLAIDLRIRRHRCARGAVLLRPRRHAVPGRGGRAAAGTAGTCQHAPLRRAGAGMRARPG